MTSHRWQVLPVKAFLRGLLEQPVPSAEIARAETIDDVQEETDFEWFSVFLGLFIHLKGRVAERKGETQLPSAGSLKQLQQPGLGQSNTTSWELQPGLMQVAEPQALSRLPLPPQVPWQEAGSETAAGTLT